MSARRPLPPRYPPNGSWPAVMRADMTAAYLDHRDVAELTRAITRGEVPPPSEMRGTGRAREPVWRKVQLDNWLRGASGAGEDCAAPERNLTKLL